MDVSDVPDEAVQAEVGVSSTTTESGGGAATGEAELRPPQSFPSMPYHTCNDGDWAIFLFGDGERRLSRVRKGAKTSVGKQQVLMDPMVGAPFDANFRSEPGCLVRDPRTVEQISGSVNDVIDAKSDASNAQLFDEGASSSAQQLGEGDIRRLKQKGMHGAELVKTIAANSVTFAGKTAFAQEKYLRKKAKKHLHYLTLVRPSPLTLCDFYMNKSPERLLSLRRDTLALMLAMSNVGPGERVLVLDGILGLAAAACLNALGGEGRVLCANLAKPQLDCPLAECLHVCQQAKGAVRLQLTESWTRKYQVAANRTHPEMSTYPPTGYLLSGVTVVPP